MKREHAQMLAQHRMERFGLITAQAGLLDVDIAFDFKQHVTVPLDYIYAVLEQHPEMRACWLDHPWREQVSSRFWVYLNRIALPESDEAE